MWMEESGFPVGEVRLFDEEPVAGTLTGVAGEAAVIQAIDEDSFKGLRFVFFAGSRAFAKRHGLAAARAGATVIDLTGELASAGRAAWIPRLDACWSRRRRRRESGRGQGSDFSLCAGDRGLFILRGRWPIQAGAPGDYFLSTGVRAGPRGSRGAAEQTVKLLSLQPIPQEVFDCQVAFNMLDRWGAESRESCADAREAIAREVRDYLADGRRFRR